MLTILIAEDNDGMADMLVSAVTAHGYEVIRARDGREALQRLRERKIDLVVTDLPLAAPGLAGSPFASSERLASGSSVGCSS